MVYHVYHRFSQCYLGDLGTTTPTCTVYQVSNRVSTSLLPMGPRCCSATLKCIRRCLVWWSRFNKSKLVRKRLSSFLVHAMQLRRIGLTDFAILEYFGNFLPIGFVVRASFFFGRGMVRQFRTRTELLLLLYLKQLYICIYIIIYIIIITTTTYYNYNYKYIVYT